MSKQDFSVSIEVEQSPKEVFNAVINPRAWWSEEIKGGTAKQNDEFLYHFKDVHIAKMKLIEVVPDKKVVWLVLDNEFNFINDKSEWVGNKIVFDITTNNGKTKLQFTQEGLTSAYECYKICFDAWSNYIKNSLHDLITTGKGKPNPKEGGFNHELLKKWSLENSH